MTPRRELGDVLRKLLLKALSLGLERGCRLAVTLAAAPILGETAFGQFVFASTATAILALAADLGLGLWTTRALARGAADGESIVRVGFSLRAVTTIPYVAGVAAVAELAASGDTRIAVVWLGVAALCSAFLDHIGAILRGSERFADETRLNLVRGVLVLTLGVAALATRPSLTSLSCAMATAAGVALVFGLALLARVHPFWTRAALDRRLLRVALTQAAPIWIAGLLSLVYFKVDTFFVRSLSGDAELGAYGAAYKLFEGAMLVPAVILAVAFPRLVRAHAERPAQRRLELRIGGALLGLGLVIGGIFFLASEPIILLVFSARFHRSADSLRVLALGVPLVFLNFGLTHFLIARDRERVNTGLAFMMLVVTIALDALLIPSRSGPGAALATVLAEVLLTVGCLAALLRRDGQEPLPQRAPSASRTEHTSA